MCDSRIRQVDILASYRAYESEINLAIQRVLDSGMYVLGKEVETFERRFSEYVGVANGIGVASGTDAVELALRACGIGEGDLVLTVSHTAVATVVGIERCGAEVVFVDVEKDSFTMSPESLEATIRSIKAGGLRTRGRLAAIVPVHLYGQMADMNSVVDIARQNGMRVVEDCAQAHGASLSDRRAGSWGDAAAFSFYPTKNLGAIGDGGIVVAQDNEVAQKCFELRQYGWRERYVSQRAGVNSRLDELQAAILNVKLGGLDHSIDRRNAIAARYSDALSGTNILPPSVRSDSRHAFHQYVVRCDHREELRRHLDELGIDTAIHYPRPVHRQPAYENRCCPSDRLPATDSLALSILSLPMHPQLSDQQVARICSSLQSWSN